MLGAGLEVWHLVVESQMVVAMRLLGMAGIWAVKPDENVRMVGEKVSGFRDAALAMQSSVWRGERPDQIMVAGIRPIRARTYSNSRRLSRDGSRDFSSFLPAKVMETLPTVPMPPYMILLVIWRKVTGAEAEPATALVDGRRYPLLAGPDPLAILPAPAPQARPEVIESTAKEVQLIAPQADPTPAPVAPTPDPAPKPRRNPGLGLRLRNLFRRSGGTDKT
ncbi:hypothetical protein [Actibacterium atlanticum]|uniref:hypothetical protein n=1 Tax=Actibacterium atlanticum TaxID=1461693 RepID=UPI00068C333D|nr:hypothetical protein [Actibacterium atlanticum]